MENGEIFKETFRFPYTKKRHRIELGRDPTHLHSIRSEKQNIHHLEEDTKYYCFLRDESISKYFQHLFLYHRPNDIDTVEESNSYTKLKHIYDFKRK